MSDDTNCWSLCFISREGRKTLKLLATSTAEDLYQQAETGWGKAVASLKFGFPPKLIERDDTLAISDKLQNNERIQVEFSAALPKSENMSSKLDNSTTFAAEHKQTRKSKRSAAKRAIEAMPAIIREQESLLGDQQHKPKRHRTVTSASRMSTSGTAKKLTATTPKFLESIGQGQRLGDGAKIAPPPGRGQKVGRSQKKSPMADESPKSRASDMSEALLGALDDSGKMGRVLRRGMKNAVQASYETTRTFNRLAAIQGGKTTIKLDAQESLQVTFQGTVDKTRTHESVQHIPRDVLEAVIKAIHASNNEALRPENLALLSPRVLWSLVYQFPNHRSIPEMYIELFPNLDWTFLKRRVQQLSEKALENLRQEQGELERGDGETSAEKALDAIAAVEYSMENLQGYAAAEKQSRQAQAALTRLKAASMSASVNDVWHLETPTEPDRDELCECIQDHTQSARLINALISKCQIHNWREMANVQDAAELSIKIGVAVDKVQDWIDRAQDKSVDEIIVEICDNNIRAVELLTEKARSGTPKDLAAWRRIPELLHQQLATTGEEAIPTVEQLQIWCQRSQEVLQQLSWLNWYATPVE